MDIFLNRWTFGEVSPLVAARTDLARYEAGCRVLTNFLPLVQGPAQRRGGSRFLARLANDDQPVVLISFAFSETTAYLLEVGHLYLRVFSEGRPLVTVAAPWAQSDLFRPGGLCALKWAQSGDVLYVVCPTLAPWKIMRFGPADWRLAPLGGWGGRGPASAVALFRERLVLASGQTICFSQSGAFENFAVAAKVITRVTLANSGGWPLSLSANSVHIQRDGSGCDLSFSLGEAAITWDGQTAAIQALDAARGISQLTLLALNDAYFEPSLADGHIRIRTAGVSPVADVYFDPRMTAVSPDPADSRGQALRLTRTTVATASDDPMEINVYSEQMNRIGWLCPAGDLLAGTSGGEFRVGEATVTEPLGPDNIKVSPETSYGSNAVQALKVGSVIFFIQRSGRKVRQLSYDFTGDRYEAAEVTVAAEHLTIGGLTAMAWQAEPTETLWAARADGALLGFTFSREQEMGAWHCHELGGGGQVSHLAVSPAAQGGRDEVYLSVRRQQGGREVYYLERLEPGLEPGQSLSEALYVDSGVTVRGAGLTEVAGLEHLEGRTVDILADGGVGRGVVRAGRVSLPGPSQVATVGLGYVSTLTTLPLGGDQPRRPVKVVLKLLNSLGGAAGPDPDHLERLEYRPGAGRLDEPPELFSGDRALSWPGGWAAGAAITVSQSEPLPLTLAGLTVRLAGHQ
ncbi:MAG: hypothetical protein LBP55_08505 [Candidatus Adiutrix sp.]|jgi:hypothetical protein|nr:hypothetical protein [Candidatus Adiutrix sp.]